VKEMLEVISKSFEAATDKSFTSGLVIGRLLYGKQRGADTFREDPSDRHDICFRMWGIRVLRL